MFGFQLRGLFVIDPIFNHPVRLTTVLLGLVLFGAIAWRRRSPAFAFLVVIGWLTTWELIYSLSGYLLRHDLWLRIYPALSPGFFWTVMFLLTGWALLAWSKGARPAAWLAAVAGVVFAYWLVTGHGGNLGTDIDVREEVLNVSAKTIFGLAYLAEALQLRADAAWLHRWRSNSQAG